MLHNLDAHIRRRLRALLLRQWKRKRFIVRIPAKMNARSGHCERRFRASRSLIGAKRRRQWIS
jgi:hypothetical protein